MVQNFLYVFVAAGFIATMVFSVWSGLHEALGVAGYLFFLMSLSAATSALYWMGWNPAFGVRFDETGLTYYRISGRVSYGWPDITGIVWTGHGVYLTLKGYNARSATRNPLRLGSVNKEIIALLEARGIKASYRS